MSTFAHFYREEVPIFKPRLPKVMEIGLTPICSYNKHSSAVKTVFHNPNTQ